MKILVIGNKARYDKHMPQTELTKQVEMMFFPLGTSDETLLEQAMDADGLIADAIAKVSGELIQSMPNLKWIQSEGVGYNGIDLEAAMEKGIPVCNNKGINSDAVAEQTILLMLALLRDLPGGDEAVREGRQIEKKEEMMLSGFLELSECSVGLIGFGDIGKITAGLLRAFGARVYYYEPIPMPKEVEEAYGVEYLEMDELLARCNMVSLHVPVTPQTEGMINDGFLQKMGKDSWLINTARGELVDNAALRRALEDGKIRGAGLDTVAPEPTQKDNVLVDLPESIRRKVIFSPHIAGVSSGTFRRAHENIWENIRRVMESEELLNRVDRK
ncbi:hydroxyacid dehydrogenase [Alkalibacter rhizosphaerae]|uniref:Hydroxyacid dehydrogenase n=1 Tax=Alkalibacter rhizosphaerae TaxID=2815577 RepID=A0A975AH04_9FIRM|nr:NAD(P)-dependent oxidoreductase [Alkalibacter rhizosphaerae]QSX08104.1 hydroxyacid dehydrogenase [Alkalibacter rhizosphaerae]